MIPSNFKYHKATSIDDAIAMLAKHGDEAKLLAGGHSLIPAMKFRLNQPGILIDIGRIPELSGIREEYGELVIGGATTHGEIASSKLVKSKIAMLAEAAEMIGDIQVRNMGTIGGSLAHADPAADWPALMLAAEAKIVVQGPGGNRSIEAEEFFSGFFMTALADDELITEIRIPIPPANTHSSYQKFTQPASRFAIVGCAAMVTRSNGECSRVRIGFTGVSETAFRAKNVEAALKGKAANAENISAAGEKAADGVSILSDHFASEEYRLHLAKVYAKRAIQAAARGKT